MERVFYKFYSFFLPFKSTGNSAHAFFKLKKTTTSALQNKVKTKKYFYTKPNAKFGVFYYKCI